MLSKNTVLDLWHEFENVPFVERSDCEQFLDAPEGFLGFPYGTTKATIWDWFDKAFQPWGGLPELLENDPQPERKFQVQTPAGIIECYAKYDTDTPGDYPGLYIDIRADWTARTVSANRVEIDVTVYLESYSIRLGPSEDAVNISLGGEYVSLATPAVQYDGNRLLVTQLASHSFRVDLPEESSNSYHLETVYNFGGTYGGVAIPAIECGGVISLSRY